MLPPQEVAEAAKWAPGQVERQVPAERKGVLPEHAVHAVGLPEQLEHGLEQAE